MREKRVRGQEKSEPLFDYDLNAFDAKESFAINFDGVPSSVLSSVETVPKEELTKVQENAGVAMASDANYITPKPISSSDPLDPEYYIGHHRRMEREERRMQVQERQRLIVTASKVRTQKELLSRSDWRSSIDKIVRIHDPSDTSELTRKRELALEEMTTFLSKFEEYNRRHNRRESHADSKTASNIEGKTAPKSKSSSSSTSKPKSKLAKPAVATEPEEISISIRPTAFGYMVPPRLFPPREFQLPRLLFAELEAYDLVESLKKKRKRLLR